MADPGAPHRPTDAPDLNVADLIHEIPSGVIVVDPDKRVVFSNAAFLEVVDVDPALADAGTPVDRTLQAILDICPTSRRVMDGLFDAMTAREKFTDEWGCSDGQVIAITGKPIKNDCYLIAVRDMAPLVAAREELEAARREAEEANEAKTQFLATMSHELRTPMTGVMGMVSLLERTDLDPQQEKYLHSISQSADTLLALLNDILDVSKMEAGNLRLEEVVFKPADLLRDRLSLFDAKRIAKNLDLGLWIDEHLPEAIVGDPLRIGQIVSNLYSNAIKFTDHGRIDVALRTEAVKGPVSADTLRLVLEVADTGVGVDPGILPTLFNPFTQADTSTTRRFGGTGLGLAICKRLAEGMGGDISIESKAGAGTTLVVKITVKSADPSLAVSLKEPVEFQNVEVQPLRILLAEDDAISRMLIQSVLEEEGHSIVTATNGAQALDMVASGLPIDVVIMDMNMPVMDGSEATARIKRERPDLPILALTADAVPRNRSLYLRSGLDAFLTKPVNWRQLRLTLARLTDKAEEEPKAPSSGPEDKAGSDHDVAGTGRLQGLKDSLPPDAFAKMVALLPEEFEKHMRSIEQAAVNMDYDSLRRAAHSIKGMMSNFGFDDVSKSAFTVERLSRAAEEGGEVDQVALGRLIAALKLKEPELKRTLKRMSG
ncbi:MAG: ATP-binding protein [Alphaproteobacteria bacterium]|nr:ATP-binding protein [Alphaproteobacteria bacterium]